MDICRKLGVTETTLYRWKRRFGDLGVSEVRELRQLRNENRQLKSLVVELSLDTTILREALGGAPHKLDQAAPRFDSTATRP